VLPTALAEIDHLHIIRTAAGVVLLVHTDPGGIGNLVEPLGDRRHGGLSAGWLVMKQAQAQECDQRNYGSIYRRHDLYLLSLYGEGL